MSRQANRYGGACRFCGQWVYPGKGELVTGYNGKSAAAHSGKCPRKPVSNPKALKFGTCQDCGTATNYQVHAACGHCDKHCKCGKFPPKYRVFGKCPTCGDRVVHMQCGHCEVHCKCEA